MGMANAMAYVAILLSIVFTVYFFRQARRGAPADRSRVVMDHERVSSPAAAVAEGGAPRGALSRHAGHLPAGLWIVLSSLRPTVESWQAAGLDPGDALVRRLPGDVSGAGQGGVPVWDYFRNSLIVSVTSRSSRWRSAFPAAMPLRATVQGEVAIFLASC